MSAKSYVIGGEIQPMKRSVILASLALGLMPLTPAQKTIETSRPIDRQQSPPAASASPTSLEFGDQLLQTISKQLKVTLTNNSDKPIKISGVDTSDANAEDFVVDYDDDECTGVTIEPGQSCSIGIVFFPLMAGERQSFLLITYGDPDNPQKIPLKGNGITSNGSTWST